MGRFATVIVCLGSIFAVAISTTAARAEEVSAKAETTKRKVTDGTKYRAFSIPKEITLTSEQQDKLDAIKKEQAPKVAELMKKTSMILSDEQKAGRKEAAAKAKADGKKGKEATAYVEEAIKLTDDQRKQRTELRSELATLRNTIKGQIYDFLTTEQREYYKLPKAKKSAA